MPIDKLKQLYQALEQDGAVSQGEENFINYMLAPGDEGHQNRNNLYEALKADGAVSAPTYDEFMNRLGLTAEDTLGIHEDDHVPTTPSGMVDTGQATEDTLMRNYGYGGAQVPTENANGIEGVDPSAIAKGAQAGAGIGGAYVGARAGGVYDLLGMPAQPTQQQPAQQQQRPAADQEQQGYGGFMMPDTSQMGLNAPGKVSVTAPKAGISAAIKGIGSPVPVKNEGQYAASSWQDDVSMDYQLPAGAKVGVGDIVQGESIPYSTVFRNFVKSTVADAVKAADAAGSQASNDFLDKNRMPIWGAVGTSGGATGAALQMMAEKAGNEKRDPEAIMRNIMNELPKYIIGNKPLMDFIFQAAASNNVSPGDFTRSIVPILLNDIRKELYGQLVERQLPTSTVDWIADGAMDSAFGKLYEALTNTKGGQEVKNFAREMTASGMNPYYEPSAYADAGRFGFSLLAQAPEFLGFGGAGAAASMRIFGREALGLMAKGYTKAEAMAAMQITRASQGLGKRLLFGVGESTVSGMVTLTGVDAMEELARQIRDREGISLSKIGQQALHGAETGALFGVVGGTIGTATAKLSGWKKFMANVFGFEAEAAVLAGMSAKEQMNAGQPINVWELIGESNLENAVMKFASPHFRQNIQKLLDTRGTKGFSEQAAKELNEILGLSELSANYVRGMNQWSERQKAAKSKAGGKEGQVVQFQNPKMPPEVAKARKEIEDKLTAALNNPNYTYETRNAVSIALNKGPLPLPPTVMVGEMEQHGSVWSVPTMDMQGRVLERRAFKDFDKAREYVSEQEDIAEYNRVNQVSARYYGASLIAASRVLSSRGLDMDAVEAAAKKPAKDRTAEEKELLEKSKAISIAMKKRQRDRTVEEDDLVEDWERAMAEELSTLTTPENVEIVRESTRTTDEGGLVINTGRVVIKDKNGQVIFRSHIMGETNAEDFRSSVLDRQDEAITNGAVDVVNRLVVGNNFGSLLMRDIKGGAREKVARYEELEKKSKEGALTEDEQKEFDKLAKDYKHNLAVTKVFDGQENVKVINEKLDNGQDLNDDEKAFAKDNKDLYDYYLNEEGLTDETIKAYEDQAGTSGVKEAMQKLLSERSDVERQKVEDFREWMGVYTKVMKTPMQHAWRAGWRADARMRTAYGQQFAEVEAELRKALGYEEGDDIAANLGLEKGNEDLVKTRIMRGSNTPEEKDLAIRWIDLRATMQGVRDHVADEINSKVAKAREEALKLKDNDGMVRRVQIAGDEPGTQIDGYVKNGTVVLRPDGTVDKERSSKMIYVQVPGEDKPRPLAPEAILGMDMQTDARIFAEDAAMEAQREAEAAAYAPVEPAPEVRQEGEQGGEGTPPAGPTGPVVEGNRKLTIGDRDYEVQVLGENDGKVMLMDASNGEQFEMTKENFEASQKAYADKVAAAQKAAELEDKRKAGIVGYSEGTPDISHPDNNMQTVLEYLKETSDPKDVARQAVDFITAMDESIPEQEKELQQQLDWMKANGKEYLEQYGQEGMDKKKAEISALQRQLAEQKARRDHWEQIRVGMMTPEERKKMKDERTALQKTVEEEVRQTAEAYTIPEEMMAIDRDSVLDTYDTRSEAKNAMAKEWRQHGNRVAAIDERIKGIDNTLRRWKDGEYHTEDEVRSLIAERALLQQERDVRMARQTEIAKQKDKLPGWYRKREEAGYTPSELAYVRLENETDMAKIFQRAHAAIDADEDVAGADKDLLHMIIDNDVPENVEEYVASNLGYGSLAWEDSGEGMSKKRGVNSELFGGNGSRSFTNGDARGFNAYLAKKGQGKSVDQVAHELWEESPKGSNGEHLWDSMDIKNAILGLLQGAERPTDISRLLFKNRINEMLRLRREILQRYEDEEREGRRQYEIELLNRYETETDEVDGRGGLVKNEAAERLPEFWRGALHGLGRHIGRRVEIVSEEYLRGIYGDDAEEMGGFNDPNTKTVYLNEAIIGDDEAMRAFTTGHEFTHVLQDEMEASDAIGIWDAYIDAVKNAMGEESFNAEYNRIEKQYKDAFDRMNEKLPEGKKLRYLKKEEIEEEIGANWAGQNVLSDREAVQDIIKRAESAGADPAKLAQRVLNWINGKIATLKEALGIGENVEKELSDMEKAKALWQEMYDIATAKQNERFKEDSQRDATNEGGPVIGDDQLPFSLSADAGEREHQERLMERNGVDVDDVESERDYATVVAMDETGIGGTKVEGFGTQKFSFSAHADASGLDAYEVIQETRKTKSGKVITEEKKIPYTDEKGNVILKMTGEDGIERIFSVDNPVTVDDLRGNENSSWELMLKHAKDFGTIDDKSADVIREKLVGLLNLGLQLGSAEEGGVKSMMGRWQWVGETVFKTIAKNGDSQYGTSADITRACKKNEQMIYAISERQKQQGCGVTPGQILELYKSIEEEGYQTPCPVCYVFSRYIRNGKYANGIINGMKKYGEHLPGGKDPWTADRWKEELDKQFKLKEATSKDVARANDDIDEIPDLVEDLINELQRGVTDERRAEIEDTIAKLDKRYRDALDVYGQVSLTNWIKTFAVRSVKNKLVLRRDVKIPRTQEEWDDFKEHALDIRLTASVYRKYPAIQRMRRSAGSAGGKEITFASDNRPGEVAIGIGREKEGDLINYYDRAIHAETAKQRSAARASAKKELKKSINIAAQQTLRGGQRMWSWSDNIERLAGDVVQNLIQMEIVKGAVQSYSKQLEGVHMVAKMGAYVNGSLMARGVGYAEVEPENTKVVDGKRVTTTDIKGMARKAGKMEERVFSEAGSPVYEENGKYYTAIFDDVIGIDPFSHDTADGKHLQGLFELNDNLDKAGNIMVGMNDMHIRTCLADPRIFFIIPWHSSGQSVHILQQMMNILGVEFDARGAVDYTNMQEEKKLENGGVTERVRTLWDRVKNETDWKCGIGTIENGDGENLSAGQRRYRFLRAQIFNGNAFKDVPELPKKPKRKAKMSDESYAKKLAEYEEQMQYWKDPVKDLARIKEEIQKDFFLKKVYDAVEKVPSKKMTTDDNNYIYPYEYWDESSTYDTADVNGQRYLEYCRRLGRKPKFSGRWDTTDENLMKVGDFTDAKGYWKLLIDRRMYGVNKEYQGLTPINSAGHDTHDADPRWTKDHFLVTKVADDAATERIVARAMESERQIFGDNPTPDYDNLVLDYLPGEERDGRVSAVEKHQESVASTEQIYKELSKAHAEKEKAKAEIMARRKAQEEAARQQAYQEEEQQGQQQQFSLGVSYQGSKNRIAEKIVEKLPKGNRFVDLFSGGGAVTHAAMLSGKYDGYRMNDLDGVAQELFLQGVRGDWRDYNRTSMTPEEFAQIKGTPEALPWSFNSLGRNVVRNDTNGAVQSRIRRIKALEGLSGQADRIEASKDDYRNVTLQPGDVVYCDIPYEMTDQRGYRKGNGFNKQEFVDWAQAQDAPVYVSEYTMPKGWTEVAVINKRGMRGGKRVEKLWVQDKFADGYFAERERAKFESDEKELATAPAEVQEESQVMFSIVEDKKDIERLEKGPKVTRYRAMVEIDGELYPPMSVYVDGKLREPTKKGVWEQSDETPITEEQKAAIQALVESERTGDVTIIPGKIRYHKGSKKGKGTLQFRLLKDDGTDVWAAYNPYFHTSTSGMNDQFASAWRRPNLVVVKVEVPESELTDTYQAPYAKDKVGNTPWKSGTVNNALPTDRQRTVTLSRYAKVVDKVDDAEVAKGIAKQLEGLDIEVPFNVVTPSLRDELVKQGVKIGPPENSKAGRAALPAYEEWMESQGNQPSFSIAPDRERKPAFYSNAQRAVEGISQKKASAEQWQPMFSLGNGVDHTRPVKELTGEELDKEYQFAQSIADKPNRIEKLRNSEYADIEGDEIDLSGNDIERKKSALNYGKKLQGYYTNNDTGNTIHLQRGRTNGGLNEVLQHNYKDVPHLQSIAAIPQIIEKSILIASEDNRDKLKNPNVVEMQHYVCGLKIGTEDYTVHALVAVDKDGNRYYDHNLVQIEKGKLLDHISGKAVITGFGTTPGTKPTTNSERKVNSLISILQINPEEISSAESRMREILEEKKRRSAENESNVVGESTQPSLSLSPEVTEANTKAVEKERRGVGDHVDKWNIRGVNEYNIETVGDAAKYVYDMVGLEKGAHAYSTGFDARGVDLSRLLDKDDSNGRKVDTKRAKEYVGHIEQMVNSMKKSLEEAIWYTDSEAAKRYLQGVMDDCDRTLDWYRRAAQGDVTIFDEDKPRMFRISRDGKGLDKKTVAGNWTEDEVREMERKLGGSAVTIETEETIPEDVRRRLLLGEDIRGWYDESDGSVHLYAPAIESVDDARYTICHEKLGHEGLRALLGSDQAVTDWGNFMYLSAGRDLRAQMDEIAEGSFSGDPYARSKAAQELFAEIAEEGPRTSDEFGLWRKVKHFLIKQAQKRGWNVRGLLNDADMRYYVLKTGEALKRYEGMDDAQRMETSQPSLLFSGRGKPRKRQGEGMASFLQRLERWEKERQREEDMRLAGAHEPEKDEFEQKWQAKWEEDDAAWRERHGLEGDEPDSYPRREEGESDESLMQRVRDYETWEEAQRDQDDKRPNQWEYEHKAYEEWRDAVREFEREWGIEDEDHAALNLFDPPTGDTPAIEEISPSGRPLTPEEAEAEHATLQDLGDALGADMSARGAERYTKMAVIQRRKDLEGRAAEDSIYTHQLGDKINDLAKKLIGESGDRTQSKKETAKKIRNAIPFIIEIPRRQREIADDINASMVWQYGRLVSLNREDIEAAGESLDMLRDTINQYGIDSEEAKAVARQAADIINQRHQSDFIKLPGIEQVSESAVERLADLMTNSEPAHRGGKPIPPTTADELREWVDDLENLRNHLSRLSRAAEAENIGQVREAIIDEMNAIADRYVDAFNERHMAEIESGNFRNYRRMTRGDLIDILWQSRGKLKEKVEGIGAQEVTGSDILAVASLFTRRVLPEEAADIPLDRMQGLLDEIGDWYTNWYGDLEAAGLRPKDVGMVENYVNHRWEHDKGVGAMTGDENYQRTRSANMRERTIPTLMTGLEIGMTPKSTDIVDLMEFYSRHNAEAMANKGLIDALENVMIQEVDAEGETIASVPLLVRDEPEFDREKYELYDIPGAGLVWVHKLASKRFANVFGALHKAGESKGLNKLLNSYDATSGLMKKINLSFSGFHMGALTEVYLANIALSEHPIDGWKNLMKFLVIDTIKKGTTPAYANPEVFKDAARHLVKLGASDDYAASEVNLITEQIKNFLVDFEKKVADKGVGKTTAKAALAPSELAASLLDWANKSMDKVLWTWMHDGLKLASYDIYAKEIRERAEKEGWDEATIDKMLDEAGQYVNDMFGGQYWELINVNPSLVKVLQRFYLSPDWLISTNRHIMALAGLGSLHSEKNFKEYFTQDYAGLKRIFPEAYRSEKDIYRAFRAKNSRWCYYFGVAVMFDAIVNAFNIWLRKKDEEEQAKIAEEKRAKGDNVYASPYELAYPDGMDWLDYTMFGNTIGKKTLLFVGRDKEGKEVYVRWGKQFRELPELFLNEKMRPDFPFPLINRMRTKANPLLRTIFDSFVYADPNLYNYWDKELIDEFGEHIGFGVKVGKNFLPFSLLKKEERTSLLNYFLPKSKGMGFMKAKEYIRDFDDKKDIDGLRMMYQACVMNGLDYENIYDVVEKDKKAEKRAAARKGIGSLEEAMEKFDTTNSLSERKTLKTFMEDEQYKSHAREMRMDEAVERARSTFTSEGNDAPDNWQDVYLMRISSTDVKEDAAFRWLHKECEKYHNELERRKREGDVAGVTSMRLRMMDYLSAYNKLQGAKKQIDELKKRLAENVTNDNEAAASEMLEEIRERRGEVLSDFEKLLKNMIPFEEQIGLGDNNNED